MKVAILGFGIEGQSAYAYWRGKGADVTICDIQTHMEIPGGAAFRGGPDYLKQLDEFDTICRTASINPNLILEANPGLDTSKITTVINEFLQVCPTKNVIGITGTKGKGTTSALTTKILEAAGKQVFLGGNIGNSPLDFLAGITAESWVVLELSSFQLYDLRQSPHIAVCLMVVPEHLNWHTDMKDYTFAKSQLFVHQSPQDIAIYFANNETSHAIASTSPGAKITYYAAPGAYVHNSEIVIDDHVICHVDELKLLGKHNWQNVCAAVTAAWQATDNVEAIRATLTLFSGLEHRLEFVREVDEVRYYNDSFGTTPETAIVAIEAFSEPKVLILGGSDKGISFDPLMQAVQDNNVRHVIVIGETGPRIEAGLRARGYENISVGGETMPEIVETAHQVAKKGDVVLLSPACASFGHFKDYKDRGYQFKLAVGTL
jgi:UDP-N-acetylmuramoylalanine--D-glutamate ligase